MNKKEEMIISILFGSAMSSVCRAVITETLNGVIVSQIVA